MAPNVVPQFCTFCRPFNSSTPFTDFIPLHRRSPLYPRHNPEHAAGAPREGSLELPAHRQRRVRHNHALFCARCPLIAALVTAEHAHRLDPARPL